MGHNLTGDLIAPTGASPYTLSWVRSCRANVQRQLSQWAVDFPGSFPDHYNGHSGCG